MHRRYRRARIKRRRTRLKATNLGPVLALTSAVVGVLGVIALLVFFIMPKVLPLIGVEANLPWVPTPTPAPTIRPTPSPHPATLLDPMELQREVVLEGSGTSDYVWFADPSAHKDTLLFAAGHSLDGDVVMDALFTLNMKTGEQERLKPPLENQQYVYPLMNDQWLVYLDAKPSGGGLIRAIDQETGAMKVVKTVYVGQPKLSLDGNHLAWIERTGTRMDKLFLCDLTTLETVTVQTFTNALYGTSAPSLSGGELLYAGDDPGDVDADDGETSGLYSVSLSTGKSSVFTPGTLVHDPITNGKQWLWRNGLHGEGDDLYLAKGGQSPKCIAEDIIDFGIGEQFAAYSKDEGIFVYFFDNSETIRITPDNGRELALLAGVNGNVVIWMDVTTTGRDIMKYARIA